MPGALPADANPREDEEEGEVVAGLDPRGFQEPGVVIDLAREGTAGFVRASFLEQQQATEGGLIVRHQDLPTEAFATSEEITEMMRPVTTCWLWALCYKWLDQAHPDPKGFHLKMVAGVLSAFMEEEDDDDAGQALFWDFASLPQAPRTDDEEARFQRGLRMMVYVYGNRLVRVLIQSHVPMDYCGSTFHDSGWCSFEAAVSKVLKKADMVCDISMVPPLQLPGWRDIARCGMASFNPAPTPSMFADELMMKIFKNPTDMAIVTKIYESAFRAATAET